MSRSARLAAFAVLAGAIAVACSSGDEPPKPEGDDTATSDSGTPASTPSTADTASTTTDALACIPREKTEPMPATASAYADLCESYLGRMPTIDCGDGVPIPILVNGKEVFQTPRNCDNPDFKGSCPVGSRVGRVAGEALDGTPLPNVVWAFFCRSQGPEGLAVGLASVQMIGHDTETGATCFLESADAIGAPGPAPYLRFDKDGYLDGELPGPGVKGFDDAFLPPLAQCTQCHHSDPFIHTPWIDQARHPANPKEPELPVVAGPESPYWVIGGAYWDRRSVHIEGNGCTACHRAPDARRILYINGVDVNSFMPPYDPGVLDVDQAAIEACYDAGPDEPAVGCEWIEPPSPLCDGDIDALDDLFGGDGGKECPKDFDPKSPCMNGDKCNEAGTWYFCLGGEWKRL